MHGGCAGSRYDPRHASLLSKVQHRLLARNSSCCCICGCKQCPHPDPTVPPPRITPRAGDTVVKPYVMGDNLREGEKPQNLTDMLPGWVGYGVLYGVSAIPVLLVIGTILILFYNSLK